MIMPDLIGPETTSRLPHRFHATAPSLLRDRFMSRLEEHPLTGISRGEVQMHFRGMPSRYWERVTKAELTWALETIHAFLEQLAAAEGTRVVVVANSRHYPARGFSKIMVCAQDRPGLLAKIAAGFSALRVNVLRADIFTRSDGVALDVFDVADLEQSHLTGADRLRQLVFLLEGALSEPPRFASVWAGEFHKMAPRGPQAVPRVDFDNDYSNEHTVVRVEATDRLGLLHDLLKALADCKLNIDEALVETVDHLATDTFYVTDLRGEKLRAPEQLQKLRTALVDAVVG
jgi:[protein-PII] uridylyltransferase